MIIVKDKGAKSQIFVPRNVLPKTGTPNSGGGIDEEELNKYLEEYATEEWVENNFATNSDVDDEIGKLENSLQFQIDSKQPKGDYISENELKTINGKSIVGDGDITIAGGKIIEKTQAEYDDIIPEPDVIYVITDAESVNISEYATKEYVNDLIGDIDKILDEIIG